MQRTLLRSAGDVMARKTEGDEIMRDPTVVAAKKHSDQLIVQAERLTHRLNIHLDEIQALIEDRRVRP